MGICWINVLGHKLAEINLLKNNFKAPNESSNLHLPAAFASIAFGHCKFVAERSAEDGPQQFCSDCLPTASSAEALCRKGGAQLRWYHAQRQFGRA